MSSQPGRKNRSTRAPITRSVATTAANASANAEPSGPSLFEYCARGCVASVLVDARRLDDAAARDSATLTVQRLLTVPFILHAVSGISLSGIPLRRTNVCPSLRKSVDVHRALVFPIRWDAPPLDWLLSEFRLLVNESIRIALREDIRSRARLARAAYQVLGQRHTVYKQYIPSAFEVALAVLKAHRRRLKRKRGSSVPYMWRLMLKAENQS